MSGLFINYRREDAAPYAGRLYDGLRRAFPEQKIFMDIDAIELGEDFIKAITQTLSASKIVIAVIGPNWDKVVDRAGGRRLDNADDYVVRELTAAIDSDVRIIPVLVGGAAMPKADTLPPNLQPLTRRQALELSDNRFTSDTERLCVAIRRVFDASSSGSAIPPLTEDAKKETNSTTVTSVANTFVALLWTSYALDMSASAMALWRTRENQDIPNLIMFAFIVAIYTFVYIMLCRWKNWSRIAFVVSVLYGAIGLYTSWSDAPMEENSLFVISNIICILLVVMMFTKPLKSFFVKGA